MRTDQDGPVAYHSETTLVRRSVMLCKYIVPRMAGMETTAKKVWLVLRLPHDWFVFGFDNGLENDIDPQQAAYFGRYAENLPESAKVILVQHDPNWVLDQYEERDSPKKERTGKHVEFLMNGPLRGKVMLRLAGDVHNYMRHEVRKNTHQVRSNSEDECAQHQRS